MTTWCSILNDFRVVQYFTFCESLRVQTKSLIKIVLVIGSERNVILRHRLKCVSRKFSFQKTERNVWLRPLYNDLELMSAEVD